MPVISVDTASAQPAAMQGQEGEGGDQDEGEEPGQGDGEGAGETPGQGGGEGDQGGNGSGDQGQGGEGDGGQGQDGQGGQDDGGGQGGDQATYTIRDVGIYLENTDTCLATALGGDYTQVYQSIYDAALVDKKGDSLKLDHVVFWDNGDQNRNGTHVTWSSSDTSVAFFRGNTGELVAAADGTVRIRATVDPAQTGGATVYAEAIVRIAGQSDAKYVESIRILAPKDDSNVDVTDGLYELREDKSTAWVQFAAEVDVFDPATNSTTTITTNGKLSQQVPELGDLRWRVGDPALASIIEDTGQFRPAKYGMVAVMVSSMAGFGGKELRASTVVSAINPNEEDQGDEYHPQDSLTVKAYYSGPDGTGRYHTPAEDGDAAYVIDKTYSLSDLQSLGALTATYTSFSNAGDYYTMAGTGVPLSAVLRDAGVNLDGIETFAFRTADWPSGENRPVTASFVFADRFYYPNIDIGSFAEAEQVFPILAWSSNQIRNSTNTGVPMTEATRFRLLFGATPAGGNSQYQIKWINTLVVVLSGYEERGTGDGGGLGGGGTAPDPDPNKTSGEGAGTAGEGDHQTGGEGGGEGRSEGEGDASAAGDAGGAVAGGQGQADAERGNATDDPDTDNPSEYGADAEGRTGQGGKQANVYQVMNRNDSDIETQPVHDNPVAPYAVPLGAAACAVGGIESLLWFRLQRRGVTAAMGGMANAA